MFVHILCLNVSLGSVCVMRSIESVVLNDEENVEQNREESESEFRRRTEYRRPVVVVDGKEEH